LWKEDCNVGKDVSQSPPGDPYREWLGTTVCPVTPSVVSAALESSPVLRRTEARVRIAYHRDPPPSSSEVGLEGYNRGVPITVTVVYEYRPIVGGFLQLPVIEMQGSARMLTQ
jgi:hypothetical protein